MDSITTQWLMSSRPDQALRLKRMMFGGISYLVTLALVVVFWGFGYFSGVVVAAYFGLIVSVNLVFYGVIRSGLNLRFADPSLTLIQVCTSIPTGLFVMYHAQDARGVFLLLCLSASLYGLFQFRTRDFVILTATLLGGYVLLIGALVMSRPQQVNVRVEILEWIALAFALLQFCALGSSIGSLRRKVKEKNQELGNRNVELEQALQRIEELAIRDELTGAYNRRHLMEVIRIEKQRSERSGRVFSICILDVDFFKRVNDTYVTDS